MKKIFLFAWALLFLFILIAPAQAQYYKRDVGRIQSGMTVSEVRNALGRPHEINTRTGPRGETQQWVYYEGRTQMLLLYFEGGVYTGDYSRLGEKPSRLP